MRHRIDLVQLAFNLQQLLWRILLSSIFMLSAGLYWWRASIAEPCYQWWETVVFGAWEEWCTSLIRQGFEETTRTLNGISTWCLSLFNYDYRAQLRRSWEHNPWQRWWSKVEDRPSTLNALVANMAQQQHQRSPVREASDADMASLGGRPFGSSGAGQLSDVTNGPLALSSTSSAPAASTSRAGSSTWRSIDPSTDSDFLYARVQGHHQQGNPSNGLDFVSSCTSRSSSCSEGNSTQQTGVAGGTSTAAAAVLPRRRWRLFGRWSASSAALPAENDLLPAQVQPVVINNTQPPARRQPEQQHRGGSALVKAGGGNKGAANGKRTKRDLEHIHSFTLFGQAAAMELLDSNRRRGLLEDAKLGVELRIHRAFDAARSVLRSVFLLPKEEALGHSHSQTSSSASFGRASSEQESGSRPGSASTSSSMRQLAALRSHGGRRSARHGFDVNGLPVVDSDEGDGERGSCSSFEPALDRFERGHSSSGSIDGHGDSPAHPSRNAITASKPSGAFPSMWPTTTIPFDPPSSAQEQSMQADVLGQHLAAPSEIGPGGSASAGSAASKPSKRLPWWRWRSRMKMNQSTIGSMHSHSMPAHLPSNPPAHTRHGSDTAAAAAGSHSFSAHAGLLRGSQGHAYAQVNAATAVPAPDRTRMVRSRSMGHTMAAKPEPGRRATSHKGSHAVAPLRRANSFGKLENVCQHLPEVSCAADVIRLAGYPLELHTVTTDDGYILQMERIPRAGAKDAVVFVHGVLDSTMAWVSAGVTSAQAFAAWDDGFDVWLANSRSNAPRMHQERKGSAYWRYNVNHMGIYDMGAQMDHIHNTKCAELGEGQVQLDLSHMGSRAGPIFSASTTAPLSRPPSLVSSPRPAHTVVESLSATSQHSQGQTAGGTPSAMGAAFGSRMRLSSSEGSLQRCGSGAAAAGSPHIQAGPLNAASSGLHAAVVAAAASGLLSPNPSQSFSGSAAVAAASSASNDRMAANSHDMVRGGSHDTVGGRSGSGLRLPSMQHAASGASLGSASSVQARLPSGTMMHQVAQNRVTLQLNNTRGSDGSSNGDAGNGGTARERPTFTLQAATQLFSPAAATPARMSIDSMGAENALVHEAAQNSPTPGVAGYGAVSAHGGSQVGTSAGSFGTHGRSNTDGFVATPASASSRQGSLLGGLLHPFRSQRSSFDDGAPRLPVAWSQSRCVSPTFPLAPETVVVADGAISSSSSPQQGDYSYMFNSSRPMAVPADTQARTADSPLLADSPFLAAAAKPFKKTTSPPTLTKTRSLGSAGNLVAVGGSSGSNSQLNHINGNSGSFSKDAGVGLTGIQSGASGSFSKGSAALGSRASAAVRGHSNSSLHSLSPRASSSSFTALQQHSSPHQLSSAYHHASGRPRGLSRPPSTARGLDVCDEGAVGGEELALAGSMTSPLPSDLIEDAAMEQSLEVHAKSSAVSSAVLSNGRPAAIATTKANSQDSVFWPGSATAQNSPSRRGSGALSAAAAAFTVPAAAVAAGIRRLAHQAHHVTGSAATTGAIDNGSASAAASGTGRAAPVMTPTSVATTSADPSVPYRLRAVGHSLGGMSLLIYLVHNGRLGRPQRLHRLILLTPAGFHDQMPWLAWFLTQWVPTLVWAIRLVWPKFTVPLFIPTFFGRLLMFKLLRDITRIPSMVELMRCSIKVVLNGDASEWDRAMQMPHYNAQDMPAMALDQMLHIMQIVVSGRFRLYDYGSAKANIAHYGTAQPPDIADDYWRLGNLPVDLVAGSKDGIIPPDNIRRHYAKMREARLKVTYREFEFGHLDFTFAVKEDLKMYLMRLLQK